jgi:hypothetical protein
MAKVFEFADALEVAFQDFAAGTGRAPEIASQA